ncbi:hypothetical protein DUI87_07054 [Hirundo rustica rustica]|uniref:Uncharacterized protein n=1 Tax=Hirundo rustica rustica TaxID=333673 RepID=A0A3M0KNQ3_HIRRU|nr:hypothetical protein DUI87_07054 [Hirundo rustica rustica]
MAEVEDLVELEGSAVVNRYGRLDEVIPVSMLVCGREQFTLKNSQRSLILGLNAVTADKDDTITHAHCYGNIQQLLFGLDVCLLFGVSTDVFSNYGSSPEELRYALLPLGWDAEQGVKKSCDVPLHVAFVRRGAFWYIM